MSKLFLVTGGAGFIGSHIVERLVREGQRVRVIDNLSTGKRENIEPFLGEVEFIESDIRDLGLVREAMEGVDYVSHQAAVPSVPRSVKDPMTSNSVNVEGTLNILIAARDAGVKRVVYASSSSVYGDTPTLPKHEGMKPEPRSPYAVSKLAGELYCQVFFHVYGLETVALRYFNVFGPRQDPQSQYAAVVPKFITAFLQGEPPTIFGDGEQSRDFTHIENVVEANLLAAKAPGVAGEVFNIACGERITVNELARLLTEIVGVNPKLKPKYALARPGDLRHSLADISKAQELLGYEVKVNTREGLERTVEWYKRDYLV
ncbi:MAG: SDR family oxidoreductase [Candidatus Acetothermia bacterium]|nr:SDR family oxidoreductase [Candidatus Acetothermia bacterium]MDH7505862.1 SDR family oxidoreductase [Candidatus Acetothermia bacterium]